jgi:hypothetical protein
MATNNRKLKGNRNKDGDLMRFMGSMSTQDMIDADIPIHVPKLVKDEQPKTMDEYDPDPTLDADIKDLEDRIKAWRDSEILKNKQAAKLRGMMKTPEKADDEAAHKTKKEVKDEKPGWHKNKGSNFWNVDTKSPYWQTEEGYQEAMKLYGEKPAWVSRPSDKKEEFVDLKPTKRISL